MKISYLIVISDLFFDTDIFKGIKAILELIYLISAPVIAYFAFRALDQIKVAKNSSALSAKREAYKITAERCEYYQERIIPLFNSLYEKILEENVSFFKDSRVDISDENIIIDFAEDDIKAVIDEILNVVNALESFSVFFVSGVGNEVIAYKTIGTTFVESVKSYLPFIIKYGQILGSGKRFNNTLKLFTIWNQRMESENLELEKKALENKLKTKKSISIKHLGEE